MRVMFGTFSAVTVLGGGVKVQVESLSRELRKQGHEVELFDPWKRYDLKRFDVFHLFGAHVGTYHLGRAMKSLGMKLAVSPVFYSKHSAQRVAALVAVASRLRKKGGFWTEHMFCKELCAMADLVLPNTGQEAEFIERAFSVPQAKLAVLPNGVEERFYHAKPDRFKQEYGLENFVLYVGPIGWGRKNTLPFLKVAAELGHPTVLIGPFVPNEYGRQCMELVAANPHIVHIPPLESDSELLESAYAACSVFVLPSFYETPGLAALEAGLAGARICITKYGGTVEYFADFAHYIEPGSRDSIREALVGALGETKSTELRLRILGRFLWSEAASKLAGVYGRLV